MIKENLEIEYKTLVTKKQLKRLLSYFPNTEFIAQTNYYYSSKDNHKSSFRIREREGKYLFTLKKRIGSNHMEYEQYIDNLESLNNELQTLLQQEGFIKPFILLGKLKTLRAEVHLIDEASLCFDMNYYGNKKDFEIEYEVSGKLGSLTRFKEILSLANIEYIPSKRSKTGRALKYNRTNS